MWKINIFYVTYNAILSYITFKKLIILLATFMVLDKIHAEGGQIIQPLRFLSKGKTKGRQTKFSKITPLSSTYFPLKTTHQNIFRSKYQTKRKGLVRQYLFYTYERGASCSIC